MAGNGPAGNPNAVRRNARVGLVTLPSEGFTGRMPKWPLPANPALGARIRMIEDDIELLEEREHDDDLSRTERTRLTRLRERLAVAVAERDAVVETEKELWRKLWRTPQAAEWARQKWDREVAQYVRHKAAAEIGSLEDSKEARLRADALGLTPKGMKALMWTTASDQLAERRPATHAATGTDGPKSRRRFKAIDGG